MNDTLPEVAHRPENYWSIVVRQFRRNRIAVASLWVVVALFLLALSADFIASDKPLLMRYKGSIYSPVLRDYAVSLSWLSGRANL
jgi:ABC-type microcin C transport system permease subunit YejE